MPTQNGAVDSRRSRPPNGATSTEPAALTKWIEIMPARRRALRPFADTADMTGIAQRDRRKPHRFCLLDADVDGLQARPSGRSRSGRRDGNDRRIHQAFDRLIGDDIARTHPIDIARNADYPVTVVAGQIGVDEGGGDAAGLLRAAANMFENLGAEVGEGIGPNMDRHLVALISPPPR